VTSSSTPQQAQSTDLRQLAFGLLEQVWLAQQAQQVHLAQLEQHCAAVLVRLQLALAATVTSTSTPQLQRSTDLRQLAYGLQV